MKPLPDRQPGAAALDAIAMSAGLTEEESQESVERCKAAFSSVTGHSHVELTRTGGEAIFRVLSAVGGSVMLPDQGIWQGTVKHCSGLGIPTTVLQTDLGLIDPERLSEAIKARRPKALFITSFAGYIAEQDLPAISEVCREEGVLLIEDASSSIGDGVLGKARYSDVIVGSAREPKLLFLKEGGFIATSNPEMAKTLESRGCQKPSPDACAAMTAALKEAPQTLKELCSFSERLKERLDGVVHRGRRGPCVGVLTEAPKKVARKAAQSGLVTESGKTIFTTCPRYDRFLEKGLVIEVKKLDVGALGEAGLHRIIELIQRGSKKVRVF